MCISVGKKCSFFGKFSVLCFLETPVLRFALLPYYRRNKKRFWPTTIHGLSYIKTKNRGLKLIISFDFLIPLLATYIRHSGGNCQMLSRRLLKQIQRFVRLLREKDCRGTAKVNDVFKLLPRQL